MELVEPPLAPKRILLRPHDLLPSARILASIMSRLPSTVLLCLTLTLVACNANAPQASLPAGKMGNLIRYGHDIIADTPKLMKANVTAQMSCQACHSNAGTVRYGGQFIGIAATFPQYNERSHRIISLQDRIAECFLYSMNGRPPAYTSREMEGIVAYITWLSRGTPIGAKLDKNDEIARLAPPAKIDALHGASLYAQKCTACHQANGAGVAGSFPPLWGSKSFNSGAGMHKLVEMAGFVKYNMPQSAPNSLSVQEAYDVSAFVLSHSRPKFAGTRTIDFPPQKAAFF